MLTICKTVVVLPWLLSLVVFVVVFAASADIFTFAVTTAATTKLLILSGDQSMDSFAQRSDVELFSFHAFRIRAHVDWLQMGSSSIDEWGTDADWLTEWRYAVQCCYSVETGNYKKLEYDEWKCPLRRDECSRVGGGFEVLAAIGLSRVMPTYFFIIIFRCT